ncbi:Hypothetical_protein [Hexamita inflata]|uniref:Hypothetical_protein n=1 Tax=Hexamita inflata TaxID=28002 RepID=A0AA86N8V7_9EUKA|nr:Hypothetical protein HINF_LOCUS2516 [Hexamita inflata]
MGAQLCVPNVELSSQQITALQEKYKSLTDLNECIASSGLVLMRCVIGFAIQKPKAGVFDSEMYIKALYSLKPVIDQFCPEISAFRVQSPCEPFYGNSELYRSFDALIDDFKYSSFYSKNLDLSDFLQKIDSFGTYLIFTNADLKINHKLLKSVYKNANIILIQFHSSNQQVNYSYGRWNCFFLFTM